jgi:hypothetical protein
LAAKAKKEPVLLTHHGFKLDSVKAVRREMARCYRLTLNGKMPSEVLSRLIYALEKISAMLEIERDQAVVEQPSGDTNIIIRSVPSGSFLSPDGKLVDSATAAELWALHHTVRLPPPASPPQFKVIDGDVERAPEPERDDDRLEDERDEDNLGRE